MMEYNNYNYLLSVSLDSIFLWLHYLPSTTKFFFHATHLHFYSSSILAHPFYPVHLFFLPCDIVFSLLYFLTVYCQLLSFSHWFFLLRPIISFSLSKLGPLPTSHTWVVPPAPLILSVSLMLTPYAWKICGA